MKHFKISYFIILWINYRIRDSNPNSVFFFISRKITFILPALPLA